jgi:hypothetical protein
VAAAFGRFDEPHAWLLRSLVEYGWTDCTRTQGHYPPGAIGGLNLARLLQNDGRDGFVVEIPATTNGAVVLEDGTYAFTVQVSSGQAGLMAVVRCPEANYFQEFPIDRKNPAWAGGYIHQSLTDYIGPFVSWRLGGNEVPWAQRVGIPSVGGEPCSAPLANFLRERMMANRPLHLGPQEGWWLDGPAGPILPPRAAVPASAITGPIASLGKGGGDPTYVSAAARAAAARNASLLGGPQAMTPQEEVSIQAKARLSKPGIALMVMTGFSMGQGLLWMANALSILTTFQGNNLALAFSLGMGFGLLITGALSLYGAALYRRWGGRVLPWYSMAYVALVPGCCLVGLPVAAWAAKTWLDPMVKSARESGVRPPGPAVAEAEDEDYL